MRRVIELAGRQFGEWAVIKKLARRDAYGQVRWVCICSCGTRKEVLTSSLTRGASQSCGCKGKDWCTTHGLSETPEYEAWAAMLQRCTNHKNKWFARYGGRGITVCKRWRKFENFYADIGPRPDGGSLDRYPDNDGGYRPGNVRWTTQKQQLRNRAKTVFLEYEGKRRSLAEWAELYGLKRKVLANRIKQGWSMKKALTTPKSGRWGVLA